MKYKLLGRSGLKVSELCLGTMGFGTEAGWGADKATSFNIMEAFANAGGNFLDTANVYKLGTSEKIIGEFIGQKDRDFFVIATKYSLKDNTTNPNASGNNRKNMMRSVEQSLKRLQTDFIDVLYLHIWDDLTPIDEILRGIDSLLQRSPERDLTPMAKHYGMTVTPWAPLAGGALTGKYLKGGQGRIKPESNRRDDNSTRITREVIAIAEKLGIEPSHVALQWTRQQGFECIPIVGATRLDQLHENLKVTDLVLSPEDLQRLDEASAIDLGFPGKFFREDGVRQNNYGGFYEKIIRRP
jgi:aryl-alcohol dehydrogenase-like predicted oxidoreductase